MRRGLGKMLIWRKGSISEDWRQSYDGGKNDPPAHSYASITNTAPPSPAPRAPAAASPALALTVLPMRPYHYISPINAVYAAVLARCQPDPPRALPFSKTRGAFAENALGAILHQVCVAEELVKSRKISVAASRDLSKKGNQWAASTEGEERRRAERESEGKEGSLESHTEPSSRAFISAAGDARIQRRRVEGPETAATSIHIQHLQLRGIFAFAGCLPLGGGGLGVTSRSGHEKHESMAMSGRGKIRGLRHSGDRSIAIFHFLAGAKTTHWLAQVDKMACNLIWHAKNVTLHLFRCFLVLLRMKYQRVTYIVHSMVQSLNTPRIIPGHTSLSRLRPGPPSPYLNLTSYPNVLRTSM
ncbi:hypothetical protein C8R45DRAFT_941952 [Mycena sanguinolenta]|nr:hypothetical protein C8R45DRAFT_941952 [Mycena sanguinolenta]